MQTSLANNFRLEVLPFALYLALENLHLKNARQK